VLLLLLLLSSFVLFTFLSIAIEHPFGRSAVGERARVRAYSYTFLFEATFDRNPSRHCMHPPAHIEINQKGKKDLVSTECRRMGAKRRKKGIWLSILVVSHFEMTVNDEG